MIGVLFNTATVIIGSLLGLAFKKGIPEKVSTAVMTAIGLCTVYIGVSGSLKGKSPLVLIISLVFGTILGTILNIDGKINNFSSTLTQKLKIKNNESNLFVQGFVTASLLFCMGAMTIMGSLDAGINGDNTTLFTKSILDLVSSSMLAATLGIGVLFSAAFVLVFQGSLVLLSTVLQPVLTDFAIAEISCAGSILILALGFNILNIAKIKVANHMPAVVLVPFVCYIFELLNLS